LRDDSEREKLLHQAAARTLSRSRLYYLTEGIPELEAEWLIAESGKKSGGNEVLPVLSEIPDPVHIDEVAAEPAALPVQNDFGFSFVRIKAGKRSLPPSADEISPIKSGKKKASQLQQDAIIEKFLNEKPFLQPRIDFGDEGKVPDLSRKSGKLKEEIVTENMAMIYIRQKKYAQAIATLHKLTLKIPEKSDYFAALIKNLESKNPL
jgi:hypothetical protein